MCHSEKTFGIPYNTLPSTSNWYQDDNYALLQSAIILGNRQKILQLELGGNGDAPAHAEGLGGDLQARRRLPPLVLISVDGADHPLHGFRVKPQLDDVPVGAGPR